MKEINHLLTFLVAGSGCLVFAFCGQLLFQATLTIAVHHGLIPVLAEVFGYVIFLCIILRHYHHLVKGL